MKPLRFSLAAQADLAAIWHYSAEHWDIHQADQYLDNIHAACRGLADGSRRGRPLEIRDHYLKYRVGSHMIYFRKRTSGLEIIRILHGRMDVERHF